MSEQRQRREYRKPQVIRIDLASDEVLAVGCKLTGTQNAFNRRLNCSFVQCSQSGS